MMVPQPYHMPMQYTNAHPNMYQQMATYQGMTQSAMPDTTAPNIPLIQNGQFPHSHTFMDGNEHGSDSQWQSMK